MVIVIINIATHLATRELGSCVFSLTVLLSDGVWKAAQPGRDVVRESGEADVRGSAQVRFSAWENAGAKKRWAHANTSEPVSRHQTPTDSRLHLWLHRYQTPHSHVLFTYLQIFLSSSAHRNITCFLIFHDIFMPPVVHFNRNSSQENKNLSAFANLHFHVWKI